MIDTKLNSSTIHKDVLPFSSQAKLHLTVIKTSFALGENPLEVPACWYTFFCTVEAVVSGQRTPVIYPDQSQSYLPKRGEEESQVVKHATLYHKDILEKYQAMLNLTPPQLMEFSSGTKTFKQVVDDLAPYMGRLLDRLTPLPEYSIYLNGRSLLGITVDGEYLNIRLMDMRDFRRSNIETVGKSYFKGTIKIYKLVHTITGDSL